METIKVVVDTDTSKAAAGFRNVKSEVQNAEGSFNKLKTGAGGVFDAIGSSAALSMAGAGAAVGAFAVKAVNQFQNLALEVDNFTQKTGTSADAASRWVEVSKDLGVSTDAVASAFGRVAREDAAGKLNEFGLAAGTTSDRFAELLDKIGRIPNENDRAAAAFKVFGRSWQDLAPLLDTTEKIKDRLAETPKGHLISDRDIASAREFRNNMDDLRDAIESAVNVIGAKLVQAINDVVAAAKELGGPIGDLGGAISSLDDNTGGFLSTAADFGGTILNEWINPVTQFGHVADGVGATVDALSTGFGLWGDSADDAGKKVEVSSAAAFRMAEGFNAGTVAVDDAAQAFADAQAATDAYDKALEATAGSLQNLAKAQNDQITAQRGVADATIAAATANDTYGTFLAGLNKEIADAKGNQEKLNGINREAVSDTSAIADAVVNLHAQQSAANGTTITATEKFDLWGNSMIDAAAKLKGPLQGAVVGYIGQVNDIPPEKLTDIQALIDQGKLDEAKAALAAASAARTAAIIADAQTAEAERELDQAARDRQAKIFLKTVGPNGEVAGGYAIGGYVGGPLGAVNLVEVGEKGPELVMLPTGSYVFTAAQSNRMATQGNHIIRGMAGGGPVGDLNIPESRGYPGDLGVPGGETGVVIGAGLVGTPPPGEDRFTAFGSMGIGGSKDIIGMGTGAGYTGPFLPVPGIPGRNLNIPERGRGQDLGTMVVVNINGAVGDPVRAGQQIVEVIKRYESSAGTQWRN